MTTFARLLKWAFLSGPAIGGALAILVATMTIISPPFEPIGWDDVPHAVWTFAYLYCGWGIFYTPWILAWPVLVRRFSTVEVRWRAFLAGSLCIASLGALALRLIAGPLFHGPAWIEVVLTTSTTVLVPWAALWLPRRTIPSLRLGAFSARDHARSSVRGGNQPTAIPSPDSR